MRQQDRGADHVAPVGVAVGEERIMGDFMRSDCGDQVEGRTFRRGLWFDREIGQHRIDGGGDLVVRDVGGLPEFGDGGIRSHARLLLQQNRTIHIASGAAA